MMLAQKGTEKDIEKYHNKWLFQEKIDGARCVAICSNNYVRLYGRSGIEISKQFPEVVDRLKNRIGSAILDGEIFAGDFNRTEARMHTTNKLKIKLLAKEYPSRFLVFDILSLNGEKLKDKPLKYRISRLKTLNTDVLPFTYNGIELWGLVKEEGREGVMIKNPESIYLNKRSWDWLKVKNQKSKDLKMVKYEKNPAGIRCESPEGIGVQISGKKSKEVKKQIDEKGYCWIEVNYFEETKNGLRNPVFKTIKDGR